MFLWYDDADNQRLDENDEGGGEGGGEGEGARELPPEQTGERDTVSLGTLFCPFFRSVAFSHVTNLSLTLSLSLSLSLFLSFFLFLFSGDRPGGGRGGRRESLADCSRSQRTANRKGLYIISS